MNAGFLAVASIVLAPIVLITGIVQKPFIFLPSALLFIVAGFLLKHLFKRSRNSIMLGLVKDVFFSTVFIGILSLLYGSAWGPFMLDPEEGNIMNFIINFEIVFLLLFIGRMLAVFTANRFPLKSRLVEEF